VGHGGLARYPQASRLLITADAGGSNGYRSRLWNQELGSLAERTGLAVTVCHLPPGTSKWNRMEHRLFSHVSMNWRGRPLVSHEVLVQLIGTTTTRTGLKARAKLDPGPYRPASRSPTPNSPPCRSPAMPSTASGTTRSPDHHRATNPNHIIRARAFGGPRATTKWNVPEVV
jgi:DDE family transposase